MTAEEIETALRELATEIGRHGDHRDETAPEWEWTDALDELARRIRDEGIK